MENHLLPEGFPILYTPPFNAFVSTTVRDGAFLESCHEHIVVQVVTSSDITGSRLFLKCSYFILHVDCGPVALACFPNQRCIWPMG